MRKGLGGYTRSSGTYLRPSGCANAHRNVVLLLSSMASSVVALWSGRSSLVRPFVGLGGAAVLNPTAFSLLSALLSYFYLLR